MHDLIAPAILFVALGIFLGISASNISEVSGTYQEYGIINSTEFDEYDWVQIVCTSDGETTICVPIPHTDYINRVTVLSYGIEMYNGKFVTTDYKGAWEHQVGETIVLIFDRKDESLTGLGTINDNSGGVTIGDGCWSG